MQSVPIRLTNHMSAVLSTISLWAAILTARQDHQFAQELQLCHQLVGQQGPKHSRCVKRIEELKQLQDEDGQYRCLTELSNIKQQYNSLTAKQRWESVILLYQNPSCSSKLQGKSLEWLLNEARMTEQPESGISLFEQLKTYTPEQQRAAARLYLANGQNQKAERLWPTKASAREGPAQARRNQRRSQLTKVSRLCLAVFAIVTLPFLRSGYRRVNVSLRFWVGVLGVSISCAIIALVREPSSLGLWVVLTTSWGVVIAVSGAAQSVAPRWIAKSCAVLAALACFALTWLWSNYFGMSAWIY